MAYDEGLAHRIHDVLVTRSDVVEKKMFGGLAFMVRGHMACGIVGDELMVRVGHDGFEDALAQPHARPMDFTGRQSKTMVYVGVEGFTEDDDLASWIARGVAVAESQPAK